jgi:drug/metabolite transporter (DMT)-like permease
MSAVLALITVIVSGVIYHLSQKITRVQHPWPMLAVAYGAAFALATAASFVTGGARDCWRGSWDGKTGILVGLAVFGIEAGYFFVYRAGWPLSTASVVASLSITIVLALVGLFGLGEALSVSRVAGLALAACGVLLIARG